METKAAEAWSTASRAHVSRGFRFNSQSLAVAFTDRLSMGGRAWPNTTFEVEQFDYAFAVWGNSTLGLLCYWQHSTRQVAGRGDITISAVETLPVLDFRELSDDQLVMAELIFEEFRDKELKPAYLADADPNRALARPPRGLRPAWFRRDRLSRPSAASPPNGAPNPPSTAGSNGPRKRHAQSSEPLGVLR